MKTPPTPSHAEAVIAVCATLQSDPDNFAARAELNRLIEPSALVRLITTRSRGAADARAALLRLMDPRPPYQSAPFSDALAREPHVA